ncbi:hypothetical protein E8E13_005064 [Curvularia kusanoi]|uniref:Uncharacterized protein n=1 Tax=Curvularia kusanoi TaxID=90978 RepID=A0A9P4TA71_CURKU|nr:hypothetical protein E8E13_005064 [Curvularia kusanoi]
MPHQGFSDGITDNDMLSASQANVSKDTQPRRQHQLSNDQRFSDGITDSDILSEPSRPVRARRSKAVELIADNVDDVDDVDDGDYVDNNNGVDQAENSSYENLLPNVLTKIPTKTPQQSYGAFLERRLHLLQTACPFTNNGSMDLIVDDCHLILNVAKGAIQMSTLMNFCFGPAPEPVPNRWRILTAELKSKRLRTPGKLLRKFQFEFVVSIPDIIVSH